MTMKYQHVPYTGTIGNWNMKYQKPYQGNISANNLKYGRLYHGSIKRDDFRPKVYGKVADKNNAYKYYQLPSDYYGVRRRNRVKPLSPAKANNEREQRNNVQKQQKLKSRAENTEKKSALKHAENVNKDTDKTKQKTQTPKQKNKDKQVKEQHRPPATAAAAKQRLKEKPMLAARKPPDPVTPFPPASPEPRKPANRGDIKITPDPVTVRSFADVTKPEPVFPPIMPVSMEDYARTARTKQATPPRMRRNPLVPVSLPQEESAMTNLLRYSRFSPPTMSMPVDRYHDSLSRSFTNVPGYNAVGSVLRSVNMYNY